MRQQYRHDHESIWAEHIGGKFDLEPYNTYIDASLTLRFDRCSASVPTAVYLFWHRPMYYTYEATLST